MFDYPPILSYDSFSEESALAKAKRAVSSTKPNSGSSGCPLLDEPSEPVILAAVTSLTMSVGQNSSSSFTTASHQSLASDDPSRFNFAPKLETATLEWDIENAEKATSGFLAVFFRNNPDPIWTKPLSVSELEEGSCEWSGEVAAKFKEDFPSGYVHVGHSPYRFLITLQGEDVDPEKQKAWTYFDVLIEKIELRWGEYALLEKKLEVVSEENLPLILGPEDGSEKGLEELAFEAIVAENDTPGEDAEHKVILDSNLFAKRNPGDERTLEFGDQTDFETYRDLWGDGARIPILAKVSVLTSANEGTFDAPEALYGAKILWNWQDNEPLRWETALTEGESPQRTKPFLDASYHKNHPNLPLGNCNCPESFGGKLGNPGIPVFPEQNAGPFPFTVGPCETRKWAALSNFKEDGSNEERCQTGVIFQPSRMAGDRYKVTAQLFFEPALDSTDEWEVALPAVAHAGSFEVFRRVDLIHMAYGNPDFGCDVDAVLTEAETLFLKEANIILRHQKHAINKAGYESALNAAIDEILLDPLQYKEVGFVNPLSLELFVERDIPADSPPIVYRELDDYIPDLIEVFKNGKIVIASAMANRNDFIVGEMITGAQSQTVGYKLDSKSAKLESPVPILVRARGDSYTNQELVTGSATGATGAITMSPACDFWGVNYNLTDSDDKKYKSKIDVFIDMDRVTVDYPRTGAKRKVTTDVPQAAKTAILQALASQDANDHLTVEITSKRNPSAAGQLRLKNLKEYLESVILNRRAYCENQVFTGNYTNFIKDRRGYVELQGKKTFPMIIVPRLLIKYIEDQLPDQQGIFLLHIPGRSNVRNLNSVKHEKDSDKPYEELSLAGALFAAQSDRHHGLLYITSLGAGDGVTSAETKSIEAVFAHEIAHALFLPHAKHRTGTDPGEVIEQKHVKGDTCLMNYDLESKRFCGLCMIRMRGWKTDPGEYSIGTENLEYQVELALGDPNELFADDVGTDQGLMARLQVLGLFSRPLNHPEAVTALAYCKEHAKRLIPAIDWEDTVALKDLFATEIKKYWFTDGVLPVDGDFSKFRIPQYTTLFGLNYLEAKIPPAQQGKPESKPWEQFMLGNDRRRVDSDYFRANPALGKIPLEARVKVRTKGSQTQWVAADEATTASVYFQLLKPDDLAGAPVDNAAKSYGGGNAFFNGVLAPALKGVPGQYLSEKVMVGLKNYNDTPISGNAPGKAGGQKEEEAAFCAPLSEGFKKQKNAESQGKPLAFSVLATTDSHGVARVVFNPGGVGGDAYKIGVFVGPDTQDKPAALGDDFVQTGTLVTWRSLRVCNYIHVPNPANEGELPDYLKPNGRLHSDLYKNGLGNLPELNLAGPITKEFAKSYIELLLEPDAEVRSPVADIYDNLRSELTELLLDHPRFNQSNAMIALAVGNKVKINPFRLPAPLDDSGQNIEMAFPATPLAGSVSLRTTDGIKLVEDVSGEFKITSAGTTKGIETCDLNYDTRQVTITFKERTEEEFLFRYHIDQFVDVLHLLLPYPDGKTPFLFNLKLPTEYNNGLAAGVLPMAVDDDGKLCRIPGYPNDPSPHHHAIVCQSNGLGKGLLMVAITRAPYRNRGFLPGLVIIQAGGLDNYSALPERPGDFPEEQAGKAVGPGIFLFGGVTKSAEEYNGLAIHEMSHALYLQHAPGTPTASGFKIDQHDLESNDICVMSYDLRSDGDHCGKCVAHLRGMNIRAIK